jgi:hypothetical protein
LQPIKEIYVEIATAGSHGPLFFYFSEFIRTSTVTFVKKFLTGYRLLCNLSSRQTKCRDGDEVTVPQFQIANYIPVPLEATRLARTLNCTQAMKALMEKIKNH